MQQVMLHSETGSLLAMAFNEFGQLILSKEGGELMLADLSKQQNEPGRIRVLCQDIKNCQGIVPLNGQLYVSGMGPQGLGVYHLKDTNRRRTDGNCQVAGAIQRAPRGTRSPRLTTGPRRDVVRHAG